MRTVYNTQGQVVSLGAELGRGGEGSVFDIRGDIHCVAKVYHKGVEPEKAAKLRAMVSLRTDRLLNLTAWPIDILCERPGGSVTGLIMPRVSGLKEIHLLYSPKSRLVNFANADWQFLVRAASNVARAFAVVHEHGHVIGDVNHGNLVVAPDATVKLIDCDSFQITPQGQRYLCEVGVSTHTPPELQGRPFKGIVRTANHDAFGLAVLIFQLLFLGRHPFSGRYLGSGDMSLEKAISEFRFAYGPGAASRQMQPPPRTLALEAVSPPVAQLFERAFSEAAARQGSRATAKEWITALDQLYKQLHTCAQHPGHRYYSGLSVCPWCQLDAGARNPLFNIIFRTGKRSQSAFDLATIWARIEAVPSPGPAPSLSPRNFGAIKPSPKAVYLSTRRLKSLVTAIVGSFGASVLALAAVPNPATLAIVFVVVLLITYPIAESTTSYGRSELKAALDAAQSGAQNLERHWQSEAQEDRFFQQRQELWAKKTEYEALPTLQQQRFRELETHSRERQFRRFLDSHKIAQAKINGIGPSRAAMLQSYGIETADDVEERAILAVPGFGPVYTNNLLYWRKMIEQRFVFNPAKAIDPADVAAVNQEIDAKRSQLEWMLGSGASELEQVSQYIKAQRQSLPPMIEQAYRAFAQAETDVKAVRNPFRGS